jgi:Trk K+ transport system NAD-binding subunit
MVAKTYSNHIVVCGVGELGKALAKRLHADHPRTRIVLVDQRPGLPAEAGLTGDNIVCLQADMTSLETLKTANCHKARLVLLTSGNDAFNLEAAYKIIQLNPQAEIWVRLHHNGLADLMDLSRKPNLHFFSPYQQAAEVIASHLLQEDKGDE